MKTVMILARLAAAMGALAGAARVDTFIFSDHAIQMRTGRFPTLFLWTRRKPASILREAILVRTDSSA
jgi:hypothetical protein